MTARKLDIHRRFSDGSRHHVGQLAQNQQGIYFQYNEDYLKSFNSLSPFKLPFNNQLYKAPASHHQGLHGVFSDSLPDGWGLLLMDRVFRQNGILPGYTIRLHRLDYAQRLLSDKEAWPMLAGLLILSQNIRRLFTSKNLTRSCRTELRSKQLQDISGY